MNQKHRGLGTTIGLLLLVAGVFVSVFIAQHINFKHKINPDQLHGAYLAQPKIIHDFSLAGIDGKTFDNSALLGHWTLVFFGFTQCPNVCPITMAELSKMYRNLEQKNKDSLPQVVLISVDPEHDSLEKLEQYVHAFHQNFYAARGEEEQVQTLASELGVALAKMPNIQHSGAVLLFNPKGELNAVLTPPHKAQALVTDYLMIRND